MVDLFAACTMPKNVTRLIFEWYMDANHAVAASLAKHGFAH